MKKPYHGSRLATLVETRVRELKAKKTQAEIAAEAGFVNPNMVSMIKSGASKLALDRVPALARALEVDPRRLFLLAFAQEGGETVARALEDVFGTIVTRNEVAWLEALREASDGTHPALTNRRRVLPERLAPVSAKNLDQLRLSTFHEWAKRRRHPDPRIESIVLLAPVPRPASHPIPAILERILEQILEQPSENQDVI